MRKVRRRWLRDVCPPSPPSLPLQRLGPLKLSTPARSVKPIPPSRQPDNPPPASPAPPAPCKVPSPVRFVSERRRGGAARLATAEEPRALLRCAHQGRAVTSTANHRRFVGPVGVPQRPPDIILTPPCRHDRPSSRGAL
jgi:hypothetical protein